MARYLRTVLRVYEAGNAFALLRNRLCKSVAERLLNMKGCEIRRRTPGNIAAVAN